MNISSSDSVKVIRLAIYSLICVSAPLWAEETTDRGASPFPFYDGTSTLVRPLPAVIEPGKSAFRMRVLSGGSGPDGSDTTYLVVTDVDSGTGRFRFERIVSGVDENDISYEERSEDDRQLTETELSSFRAAFEKLRLCSAGANGKDGMDGWGVYVEFANETRHCFAERWAPDYENYAPEFNDMSKFLFSLVNDGLGATDSGD